MKKKFFLLYSCAFFIITGLIQYVYDSRINYFDTEEVIVTLPDSKTLKVLSIGFDHLTGDLIYLWAIQLFSSYNITNSYEYIEHIFNTITDLLPEYRSPYTVGAMIMAHEKKDPKMAIKLLERGASKNPDDWYLLFEAGFYAFKNLKDYNLAETLFKQASQKSGAPDFLIRHSAHMSYMGDDLDKSRKLWKEIELNAIDDFQKKAAINHLYQIKYEADKKVMDKILKFFKDKYSRYPASLNELLQKQIIKSIPLDYRGNSYIYDKSTGKFTARKTFAWKKLL